MAETKPTERAYEEPDPDRPASSAPTEGELEYAAPAIPALDRSPPRHDPYAALRHPNYLIFSVGWLISVVGHHMVSTALGWEVYDRTGSKLALGWVAGIQVIPLFALALPAGHWADKFDRRRIIAISSLGAAICSLGLALLSYRSGSVPWMYAILGLNAAFLVIGRPARSSLLPLVVPPSVFPNAVTWNSSLFQLATMGGPALAGVIVAWSLNRFGSVSAAYYVDVACALSFAAMIFTVRIRPIEANPSDHVDRSLLAGFRFIWQRKVLLATMTLDLFAVLLGGAVWLLPVFAKDILKVGPSGLGWLRAADAIGAFVMAMIIAHLPPMKHAGRNMLLAVAGFGAATIVFGLSRNFWLSMGALFLIGAFDAISVVVRHTLVQVLTPDPMRGRVSAVNNISIGASNELGGLESGLTAALMGPIAAVIFGGVGTIVTVVAVALLSSQLRRFGSLVGETSTGPEARDDDADADQLGSGAAAPSSTK
ncbi:MAG: MFS transporter [Tepidisphaeraceae bacterium]